MGQNAYASKALQDALASQPAPAPSMGSTLGVSDRWWGAAGQYLKDKYVSPIAQALMAPGDAYNGNLQVRNPETGLPSDDAIQRANDLAGILATGGFGGAGEGTVGIFGGKGAATANNKWMTAESLERVGESPRYIHDVTGWHRGADGQWRFEIPDNNARVDLAGRNPSEQYRLSSILKHPELYEAYPEMADVMTSVKLGNVPNSGRFSTIGQNGGAFIEAAGPSQEDIFSTLLHESQHGVQNLENFAPGANRSIPLDQYRLVSGEVEARNVQRRRNWSPADRLQDPPWVTQDVPSADQIVRRR